MLLYCRRNHLPIMRLLLKAPGIQLDAKDTEGVTPLGRAAELGNEEAVLLLLQHGCARGSVDMHGRRPLDLALAKGKIGIAAILEADAQGLNCNDLCAEGRVSAAWHVMRYNIFLT
jgi:ankyrin repeat protein